MSKELAEVRLSDLLPDSIAQDDNVRHSATALDKQLLDPELPAEITLKPYGDPRNVMISR